MDATLWQNKGRATRPSQTFTYDAFGNINKTGSPYSFNPSGYSSNRMTQIGNCTPSYDADGNVLNDCLNTYSWDAAGRLVSVDGVEITYDALGRVVEQNRAGSYSELGYTTSGAKIRVMNGQSIAFTYTPLVGGVEEIMPNNGNWYYTHADWLGNARLATYPNQTVVGDVAYAPFGETYASSGTPWLSFTGMDQQTSANLYDFPAREYGIQGRWPSPDPAGLAAVDPSDPQSWNRYAYVVNNPLSFTDPTGLDCEQVGGVIVCTINPPPPDPVCDPSWTSCEISGGGGDSSSTPGVVGPTYCGGNPQCGKSDSATCVAKAIADGRSPAACNGDPVGGSTTRPPRPQAWYQTCGAKAVGNALLHGAVDAVSLVPGVGTAAVAISTGVSIGDTIVEGNLTDVGMTAAGTLLTLAAKPANALFIASYSARAAEAIPGAGTVVGLIQLGFDGYKAFQQYQVCTAGGN